MNFFCKMSGWMYIGLIFLMCGLVGCSRGSASPDVQTEPEIEILISHEPNQEYEDIEPDSNRMNSERGKEELNQKESQAETKIPTWEEQEAVADCTQIMEYYADLYENAEKGDALNVVLGDETILQIQERVKELHCPVTTKLPYANMENYEILDEFIKDCIEQKDGEVIVYEIHTDGGIGRLKFSFDGTDMYVLSVDAIWNKKNEPVVSYCDYNRIDKWEYTEKGWFCYQLCVPDETEVSEIVDGSRMVRILPLSKEQIVYSKMCVQGIGYQGNNLLCSDWNVKNMETLDFNGLYEYLYQMKYQERFILDKSASGIVKEQFENLIMEYLLVTREEIRQYAVFDEETQTYAWTRLGAGFVLSFFGNAIPEVTKVQENADGTITLTVDAVCDKVLYDDAMITHELLIRLCEDGSFQYLGNKILGDGLEKIPEYQYRVKRE